MVRRATVCSWFSPSSTNIPSTALSRSPEILLLDEPTSALDPETCFLVEQTLKQHRCVWITHDPRQEARVASASIYMPNLGVPDHVVDVPAAGSVTAIG
ncbi:hypothetical protein BDK51DRAFT_52709 [Blyttiomyces helicus]|uniref:P-loop containing nucleoside triphosphate hydrolase protein n=1 Tax=Blyttiomyces helicus TaxID=388810 RepID=A0A4P9VV58_9FUNG|nr:hypothetical protein BDK51DRAFT_52709 [Blyttiomyces helicus]|eukprot:RKO83002.1 hypothetical protein BDK51DRAFT_52709 [Blyttiomyces helicus]